MNTIPSAGQIVLILMPVFTLLVTILAALWKFNNNVVRRDIALKNVIEKSDDHDSRIESHGNKISELIGSVNSRVRQENRIEPLVYE